MAADGDYAYEELSAADTTIWTATNEGNEEGVKEAIKSGATVDYNYDGTYTVLHIAASKGLTKIVKILVEAGWDVTLVGQFEDQEKKVTFEGTPLHHAAESGHLETAQYLLEHGADINATDGTTQYYTPLLTAIRSGRLSLIELFIQKGADTSAVDGAGETLINVAADFGHVDILKYLLGKGFSVNSASLIHTPLIAASESGHIEAVKFLLESGAQVNAVPEARKDTALHVAAETGNEALLKLLLQHKADPSLKNTEEKRPVDVAASPQIAQLLT